jgi:hypothetical protein
MAVLAVGAIAGLPVAVHRIDMLPRSVRRPRQASLLKYRDAEAPSGGRFAVQHKTPAVPLGGPARPWPDNGPSNHDRAERGSIKQSRLLVARHVGAVLINARKVLTRQ